MIQSAVATDIKRTSTTQKAPSALAGQSRRRSAFVDVACLLIPLALLAAIGARVDATGSIQYQTGIGITGDYYHYVNMAIPNGSYYYSHITPFAFRVLVPLMVHGLILLNVPFQTGFFSIMSLSFIASTVIIFYLVRGAGLSRFEATCASLAFVTLNWAVAYNFWENYLVDPTAQALIAGTLLAVQRQKYHIAAIIVAFGVACKESIYIGLAIAIVQVLVPYLRPMTGAARDLLTLRVVPLLKRVPRQAWINIAMLLAGPVIVTFIVHKAVQPIGAPTSIKGTIEQIIHTWNHYLGERFAQGKLKGLATSFALSTWGTYAAFFAISLGVLPLRAWPRARFSAWALLVAFLILLYSYTVSFDSQRLSIAVWPLVLLYAAITLHELATRLRVPVALLWGLAFVAQLAFQPIAGPNPPGTAIVGPALAPFLTHYGGPIMAVVAWIFVALIALVWLRGAPASSELVFAGASTGIAISGSTGSLQPTTRLPALRAVDMPPLSFDTDSTFWSSMRGGLTALENLDLWLAADRLQAVVSAQVLPLAQRDLGLRPDQLDDPRLATMRARWLDRLDQPAGIWRGYDAVMTDYRSLRQRLGVSISPQPNLEREAQAILEVATRHETYDTSEIVSWRRLSIVLPSYNEEAVIAQTVHDCLRTMRRYCPNAEVIVVDDGSSDRTGAIADELASRDARVVAVHNRPNKGYGGALQAGFAAVRGEWVFFMDSDGQFEINDIARMLIIAEQHPGTVVLGYRQHRQDAPLRRLNAWGWKQLVGLMLGLRGIRDIDCAFKLFPTDLVRACNVTSQGAMVNTELLVKLQHLHVPMEQVPVKHFARTHGTATGANIKVILKAFRELMRLRAE